VSFAVQMGVGGRLRESRWLRKPLTPTLSP
jgi:hypothetical protein